jgi:hypothetical protein
VAKLIITNNDGNCKKSYIVLICSDLLKYHRYILCFLDDRPSTDIRDTDAAKGQGNLNARKLTGWKNQNNRR